MKKPSEKQLNTAFLYSIDRLRVLGDELIKLLEQLNPLERSLLRSIVEEYKRTCEGLDRRCRYGLIQIRMKNLIFNRR